MKISSGNKMYRRCITSLLVYLIGQLAKNDKFAFDVTDDEIIQAAISVIKKLQNGLGGTL